MSKGRFMLGIGPGGLISDFELFKLTDHAARNRMVVEAVDMIERIWSQDPPYDLKGEFWDITIKDGINAKLGVGFMPKPYQQPRPPIFISLASPNSSSAQDRGGERLGHHLGQHHPDLFGGHRTGRSTARPAAETASRRAATTGGSRATSWWRRPTQEAHDRVFGAQASNNYFYTYMREVLNSVGLLSSSSRGPTCPTTRRRVQAITDRMRDPRLAQDRARQAGRVPRDASARSAAS